ncbi:MAG: hypothetical protein HN353_13735 [Bdellovibrionales bacterium]|nr:hypothetical protein [Bdellovibrionales bacterium]MBT3524845.1 hypothetical protein [Bdellovibrionales bacterium]MBT7668975.1 hypothetical protein [Bdellovibrionales bacterium]MBT7767208.1 hypothetical protein [Bdellovibrionales bacterium]
MVEEFQINAKDNIALEDLVRQEYRGYQIYTLMDRAIPYLQDGLKPGQRRILFTLFRNQNKGLIKVSAATGLVLTLHPHGPASIESTIVNLAQDYTFANNYPLIDKKGYFGERMETSPAAGRYIECKVGAVAKILLFDDMNQINMVPNYDEKVLEPEALLPKLPLMLLNGAEGIGTGFSSNIPSFGHKDVIASMISFIQKGKAKKIKPHVNNYSLPIQVDKQGKLQFAMTFKKRDGQIFITELPRGYDATKIYRHLTKFIDKDYLKDFIDSSVGNEILIELLFKRGQTPPLAEVEKTIGITSSMVPNYTLISAGGVRIFSRPEEIIELFTAQRLEVVRIRYELLAADYRKKIKLNNEVVRFIRQKHYVEATKTKNRKTFVLHLEKNKFTCCDYLADMSIYRMTKDEVAKRKLLIKEDTAELKRCEKIAASPALVKKNLIMELEDVKDRLNRWLKDQERDRVAAAAPVRRTRKKKGK